MSKDERQRRRRVQKTWQHFDDLAARGPYHLAEIAESATERMQAASLDEQERIAREAVEEIRRLVKPAVEKLHEAFNRASVEATGMKLEDYLWLRDYEDGDGLDEGDVRG